MQTLCTCSLCWNRWGSKGKEKGNLSVGWSNQRTCKYRCYLTVIFILLTSIILLRVDFNSTLNRKYEKCSQKVDAHKIVNANSLYMTPACSAPTYLRQRAPPPFPIPPFSLLSLPCGGDQDDPGQAEQELGLGKWTHVPVEMKGICMNKCYELIGAKCLSMDTRSARFHPPYVELVDMFISCPCPPATSSPEE